MDEEVIEIIRTPEVKQKAIKISTYLDRIIEENNFNDQTMDMIVSLLMDVVSTAEKGAYEQGFDLGIKFGIESSKNKKIPDLKTMGQVICSNPMLKN